MLYIPFIYLLPSVFHNHFDLQPHINDELNVAIKTKQLLHLLDKSNFLSGAL